MSLDPNHFPGEHHKPHGLYTLNLYSVYVGRSLEMPLRGDKYNNLVNACNIFLII